jgi:hypothetical protein
VLDSYSFRFGIINPSANHYSNKKPGTPDFYLETFFVSGGEMKKALGFLLCLVLLFVPLAIPTSLIFLFVWKKAANKNEAVKINLSAPL